LKRAVALFAHIIVHDLDHRVEEMWLTQFGMDEYSFVNVDNLLTEKSEKALRSSRMRCRGVNGNDIESG
jgi:hypothetical protein